MKKSKQYSIIRRAKEINDEFIVFQKNINDLKLWNYNVDAGCFSHDSNGFFKVVGVQSVEANPIERVMIDQQEKGLLGLAVRTTANGLEIYVQIKPEPGNLNKYQFSPTIQATQSNINRVHNGTAVPLIGIFKNGKAKLVASNYQSEHGEYFYGKSNLNQVIEIDVAVQNLNFYWIGFCDFLDLLQEDNLVNMDLRSTVSQIPFCLNSDLLKSAIKSCGIVDEITINQLLNTYDYLRGINSLEAILAWFASDSPKLKDSKIVKIDKLSSWSLENGALQSRQNNHYRYIGIECRISGREIFSWEQPILHQIEQKLIITVVDQIDGVLHVLVRRHFDLGYLNCPQINPTFVLDATAADNVEIDGQIYKLHNSGFLKYCLEVQLSEEGGRFYDTVNNYKIVINRDNNLLFHEFDPTFVWIAVGQLNYLVQNDNTLSLYLRTQMCLIYKLLFEGGFGDELSGVNRIKQNQESVVNQLKIKPRIN